MKKIKRVLITGVNGFLGSALAENLLREGIKVIGVDVNESGFLSPAVRRNINFQFHCFDLCDYSKFACLEKTKVEGVFHLASRQPSSRLLSYHDFYLGNVVSTMNIIEYAKKQRVSFIVYASTVSVCSAVKECINEDSPVLPVTRYSLTKYLAERMLCIELGDSRIKRIIIRFSSIFGKNHHGGFVHEYCESARAGKDIEVFNNGLRYRNAIYVNDAVAALVKAMLNLSKMPEFEVFVVGSRDSLKIKDIAGILRDLLDSGSRIIPVNKGSDSENICLNITKASRILNFSPMGIEEGIKAYVAEKYH